MTEQDFPTFVQELVVLQETLDGPTFSEGRLLAYFEALNDLPLEAVVDALRQARRSSKFMPKPVEIRELVGGTPEDAAENAWQMFHVAMRHAGYMRSLVTLDAALGDTILAMFGSWPQVCAAEFSPEMWAAKRKEFGRIYHVRRKQRDTGPRYLVGHVEASNAGHPEWAKYAELAVLGGVDEPFKCLTGDAAQAYRATLAAASVQGLQPLAKLVTLPEHTVEP